MNQEVSERVERWLNQAQKKFLLGEELPCVISLRKRRHVNDDYARLEQLLRSHPIIKVSHYKSVKEGRVKVSRPSEISITQECLLAYRPELVSLKVLFEEWFHCLEELGLRTFIEAHYSMLVRAPASFSSCIEVFKYLIRYRSFDSPWILPRQLPHGESTKLVGSDPLLLRLFVYWRKDEGSWKDFFLRFRLLKRPAEFRFFAPILQVQQKELRDFHGLISVSWKEALDFSDLQQTLIVENRQSFDAICARVEKTLLIFGSGWKVSQLTSSWKSLPKPIFYWGDIDKEGFEIFSYLSDFDPLLKPLLMDECTFESYRKFGVKKETSLGPFRRIPELQSVYEKVCRSGLMIEQEKLPLDLVPLDL